MRRIKCFVIEKTGRTKAHQYTYQGKQESSQVPLYRRVDTGEEFTLSEAPTGALYRATWYEDKDWQDVMLVGHDGQSWCCVMPGGRIWAIDSRASNCTMKTDMEHRCWIRHGKAPDFTVDKNGKTCAAGAGSILVPGFHGFLRNGWLEEC